MFFRFGANSRGELSKPDKFESARKYYTHDLQLEIPARFDTETLFLINFVPEHSQSSLGGPKQGAAKGLMQTAYVPSVD